MKFTDILKSSSAKKKDFIHKNFVKDLVEDIQIDIEGNVHIRGSLRSVHGIKIEKLPFKISTVSNKLELVNCGLTSLENFPNFARLVNVNENATLTTLRMNGPLECNIFLAENTGIKDFEGNQFTQAKSMYLTNCKNLVSLNGLNQHIYVRLISLQGCQNFNHRDPDLYTYNIRDISVDTDANLSPFLMSFLKGYPKMLFHNDNFEKTKQLNDTIKPFTGTGPKNMINLIRALKDAGYKVRIS